MSVKTRLPNYEALALALLGSLVPCERSLPPELGVECQELESLQCAVFQ